MSAVILIIQWQVSKSNSSVESGGILWILPIEVFAKSMSYFWSALFTLSFHVQPFFLRIFNDLSRKAFCLNNVTCWLIEVISFIQRLFYSASSFNPKEVYVAWKFFCQSNKVFPSSTSSVKKRHLLKNLFMLNLHVQPLSSSFIQRSSVASTSSSATCYYLFKFVFLCNVSFWNQTCLSDPREFSFSIEDFC